MVTVNRPKDDDGAGYRDDREMPDEASETPATRPSPDLPRRNRALGLRLAGLAALVLASAIGVALLVLHVEATYAVPKP